MDGSLLAAEVYVRYQRRSRLYSDCVNESANSQKRSSFIRHSSGTLKVVRAVEQTKKHGLRLKVPKTKSSKRTINLPQSLLEGLRKHRKEQAETLLKLGVRQIDQNFVFATWDGNLRSPNGFTSEFGRFVTGLELSDLGFHSLRHTHASALLREGVPITTVSLRG